MPERTKVITLQKDLYHPEAAHLDILTLKRNYIRDSYPLHIHDHYEMELVVSGAGKQWLNGELLPLMPGTLYILSPEDMHRFVAEQPLELICMHINAEDISSEFLLLLKECRGGATVKLDGATLSLAISLLNNLHREIQERVDYVQQRACAVLTLLLTRLLGKEAKQGAEYLSNQPALVYLRRALEYISEHYHSALSLHDAASACNLSPCYFSSIFSRYVGVSFSTYLMDTRLRHARYLLRQTSLSVTQIAYDCGFSSLSNFLRMFRRQIGCTPKEYRCRESNTVEIDK